MPTSEVPLTKAQWLDNIAKILYENDHPPWHKIPFMERGKYLRYAENLWKQIKDHFPEVKEL